MLVGIALIAVAVLLCCALLVTLSIYALPLFCGITIGIWVFDSNAGLIAALVTGFGIAVATLATAHILIATVKSPILRALIALAFAAPAAFTGYHAVHGIAAAAMPPTVWQQILSCAGAALIGAVAWSRVAATPPRSPYPSAG